MGSFHFHTACLVSAHLFVIGLAHPSSPASSPSPSLLPRVPVIRRVAGHHRDRSFVGGDVILGGFLMAIVAVIFCYIRATRKKNQMLVTQP
ncbi:unnamed protein product [Linum tenue]|uniref:Uncharacterized protein n=1 Tax=Linum tenue TaxID=586396 RepID=A0AAV0PAI6_9ROSI|nr:unnamed protein product [Linum tenue]